MLHRSCSFLLSAATVATMGLLTASHAVVSAATTLSWDPMTSGTHATYGSGTWNATNSNWSNGTSDQIYASGSPVVFGGTQSGTATVTLSGTQSASTVTFNTSGYDLTGAELDPTSSIIVSANQSAEIDSILGGSGNILVNGVAAGATLTLKGGDSAKAGNTLFLGGGGGDIVLNAGTYSNQSIWLNGANVTQDGTADVALTTNGALELAYGASTDTYTINSAAASISQVNAGYTNFIGRSNGVGKFDIENGSVSLAGTLRVGGTDNSTNEAGTLNVSGGILTMGPSGIIYINYAGTAATNAGTFNFSGGTVTAPEISFGDGGTFLAGSTAALNVTDGTLYLGAGGIVENALGSLNASVALSGGTVGATANWSSSMAMTLGTTNGNITFQTANAAASAENIALSGALSGVGGLNKTGGGSLTLSGANTYGGATTVSAGTLAINGTQANSNITIDSGATVNGSGTLTFNINNDTADLITDSGALDLSGLNLALNLTGTQTLRQYVLANYTGGSYSGTFASFNAPAGWSINYTGTPNEILLVNAVPEPAALGIMAMGAMGMLLIGRRRKTA